MRAPSPSLSFPVRSAALLLGLTLGAVALAQPALAAAWGPLTSSYKGQVRVSGRGDYSKHLGAYARSTITVTDTRNDGNSVYGRTTFQFYRTVTGTQGPRWASSGTKSTAEHSGAGVARTTRLQTSLRSDSDRSRGVSQVCAQMGWPVPDSCSANAFATFSY